MTMQATETEAIRKTRDRPAPGREGFPALHRRGRHVVAARVALDRRRRGRKRDLRPRARSSCTSGMPTAPSTTGPTSSHGIPRTGSAQLARQPRATGTELEVRFFAGRRRDPGRARAPRLGEARSPASARATTRAGTSCSASSSTRPRLAFAEQGRDLVVALLLRDRERGTAVVGRRGRPPRRGRAGRRHRRVAVLRGGVQRREAAVLTCVRVGARSEQQVDDLGAVRARRGGAVQRHDVAERRRDGVDVRAVVDEEARGLGLREERGEVERGAVVGGPRVDERRVDVEQLLDPVGVTERRRLEHVELGACVANRRCQLVRAVVAGEHERGDAVLVPGFAGSGRRSSSRTRRRVAGLDRLDELVGRHDG